VQLGDTIFNGSSFMILDSLDRTPRKRFGGLTPDDIAIGGMFTVFDVERKMHQLEPLFVIRDRSYQMTVSDSLPDLGLKISFEGVNPESESFKFVVEERAPKFNEFIVMKAIIFPGINILWLGCIIMAIGTFFAVFTRIRKNE
jgi:cytochrome c-type biogenesis protein CcmF